MRYGKVYEKLLAELPSDLRANAIQYRQLKKLINQVVSELNLVGLSPEVLHDLLEERVQEEVNRKGSSAKGKEKAVDEGAGELVVEPSSGRTLYSQPRVVYEVNNASGKIEPKLRIWLTPPTNPRNESSPAESTRSSSPNREGGDNDHDHDDEEAVDLSTEASPPLPDGMSLIWALQRRASTSSAPVSIEEDEGGDHRLLNTAGTSINPEPQEIVISLVSDTAFFELLSTALTTLINHLCTLHANFIQTLTNLARDISDTARPASSSHSYRPHSMQEHPGTIRLPKASNKSDLYSWREILQLYVELEVFETLAEAHRGQNSIDECERRLKLFAERVTERGLGDERQLKLKQSREALQTFLELNMFILNIKKFQIANAQATRKILKKHAKRTSLRITDTDSKDLPELGLQEELARVLLRTNNIQGLQLDSSSSDSRAVTLMGTPSVEYAFATLPRILVQAIGETLLPVIPSVEDYSCIICTSIAFKPIRLDCGHLFCVRCLVKMQKRNQGDCPMCRAPTVVAADRSNVDWALLNFMTDWFPIESRDKLKQSEEEAAQEQMIELGIDPNQKCVIM